MKKYCSPIIVGLAIACCLSVASAELKQGLRGVFFYTYDETFTGADLQVQELDSKAFEKLFATKEFLSKPKSLESSYEFLALLDGRCDLQLKCEKKECAKSVEKSCPAKEICPSCKKCESCTASSCPSCPKTETCGKILTPAPVITTRPPTPVTTTPTPTKPATLPPTYLPPVIVTTPTPTRLTTQAPTYLPPAEITTPQFRCSAKTANDPRCAKPTPPPFACTAETANDPRCAKPTPPPFACTAETANDPRCAKPTPPPFACTTATARDPRCTKPTPPPFACTAKTANDPRCVKPTPPPFACTTATARDPRCTKPTPPPFACTAATANDPRCVKTTTVKPTTKFVGPTYIPQRGPVGTTREPWTGSYVINTGTFRQSYTWVPFQVPGTYKTRSPGPRSPVTTTPKYDRSAPEIGLKYA